MFDGIYTDLSLQKSVDDYTPELGQKVTWTLTVSNEGPSWAENVRVDDMLPEGMEFVSSHATVGGIDISSGIWSLGGMGVGEVATATVTMKVIDVDNYINNYAKVSTDTYDWNGYNDKDVIAVDPWEPTQADLSLVKTVSNSDPEVGSVVDWTVSVTNSGPDTAWGTTVTEILPEGLTFEGARASTGTYDFESGVWNVGHLADGETAEIVISTNVDSEAGAQFVNNAITASSTADADTSNNTASATITVAEGMAVEPVEMPPMEGGKPEGGKPEGGRSEGGMGHSGSYPVACCCHCDKPEDTGADLQIVKLVSNPTPNLNSEVVWSLVVTNNGPEDAVNVVVNDNLPAGVEYVSDSTTMGAFDVDAGVWEIGDLANGESALLQITTIATDAAAVQTNIALVSSDTEDSNPGNNVAIESIDAVAADLELVKEVIPTTAAPEDTVEWTITVTNKGPDDATGVEVEDVLPAGVSFVSDSTDGANFDPDSGVWNIGDLASGDTVSLTIEALVVDTGELTNVAQIVASDQFDPDSTPANDDGDQSEDDEDNAVLTVPEIIDLELTQSINTETPEVGDVVTFTIEVANVSTVPATGVSVMSDLTEHFANGDLTFEGSNNDGVTADPASDWVIGPLAAGETITLTVDATVNVPGVLVNVAEVATADQEDIDSTPGNNIPAEDDQAPVSITVPVPGPTAVDDANSVTLSTELLNVVIMVDHSGSMGSDNFEDQNPSPFTGDVVGLDGVTTSRLEVVRDAIEQFANREEIGGIKILGFDGSADPVSQDIPVPFDADYVSMPHSNVSEWFDVSGGSDGTGLRPFLDDLRASGFTNYGEALELSREQFEADTAADVVPPGQVNYYFFTDGIPLADEGNPRPDAAQQALWEDFVEDNFEEAYGIAFGGGATPANLVDVDLVSHQDLAGDSRFVNLPDSDFAEIREEENTIATNDVTDIPSILFRTIADTAEGNILEDDIGSDGVLNSGISVSELTVGTTIFTAADGPVEVETPEGGFLEFDFTDGSYVYFAPFVDVPTTETFSYTISDGNDTDDGILVIDVEPPANLANAPVGPVSALVADNDDLFTTESIDAVQFAADFDAVEWSGNGDLYTPELYDAAMHVI